MILVNADTLLSKIVPYLTGCNDDIAKLALIDAARTFARESDIILEVRSYDESDAPEYGRIPEFADNPENFMPHHFIDQRKNQENKRIYVTYSLLPKTGLIPESIMTRHYEAIVANALFTLYNMPGKPWSSADMAAYQLQKYRIALGDAIRDNTTQGAVYDQFFICADPGETRFNGNLTVNYIGGTDTSGGTITAETILAGYIGFSNGERIIGNIGNSTINVNGNTFTATKGYVPQTRILTVAAMGEPDVDENVVTIPVGYNNKTKTVVIPKSDGLTIEDNIISVSPGYIKSTLTETIPEAKEPTVTENVVTVNKGYVKEQKTVTIPEAGELSVSGNKVTVPVGYIKAERTAEIPVVSATLSDNKVTIPAGYNAGQTLTVAEAADTTIDGNIVTVYSGYHSSNEDVSVGQKVYESTFTPTTSDQYIETDSYIAGRQTIKGDANLVAGNIKKDVSIFGIVGTLEEGTSGGYDTSTVTATAETMLSGVIAIGTQGETITGNIPDSVVTETESNVTITKGYLDTDLNYDLGSGGGGDEVVFGYVNSDGLFQALDMSVDPAIESGEPEAMDVVYSYNRAMYQPLTFTAQEDDSSVGMEIFHGSPMVSGLQYRLANGAWTPYTVGEMLTLQTGESIHFQNTNGQLNSRKGDNPDLTPHSVRFKMTGKIAASGNIMSMLNYAEYCTDYCFHGLFRECKSLTTAPELPATTLAAYCYGYMFSYCTSLTTAPKLPATTMDFNCYHSMFIGCASLTTAPELPATELDMACYSNMFSYCTSLTTAPKLPATTLKWRCYSSMFSNCTSLTSAPELPAVTLDIYCYGYMFYNCKSLTAAPELPATTLVEGCYLEMFCGCSKLQHIKVGFTAWDDLEDAYPGTLEWVNGVSASGEFVKPAALPEEFGTSRIPDGWTVTNV